VLISVGNFNALTDFPENQHNPRLLDQNLTATALGNFMNCIPRSKFVRSLLLFSLCLSTAAFTLAQSEPPLRSITYRLAMPRPVSHLFEVTMEVELPEDQLPKSIDLQMAK